MSLIALNPDGATRAGPKLHSLPIDRGKARAARAWRKHPFIAFGVFAPTLLVAIYSLFIASPVFVSESKFVVRLSSPPSQSAIGAMLQSSGIARSQDDTFSVADFLLSRDALRRVGEAVDLRRIVSAAEGDALARYPRFWESDTFEGLYRYYLSRTEVIHNASTGITTLRTRAFAPEDAQLLNRELLNAAANLLVRLNNRAREDAIAFSRKEVEASQERLLAAQNEIARFRNQELMIDPSRVSVSMLDTTGRLSTELALTRARRAEAETSAPDSGAVPNLKGRVAALEDQIDRERLKLVGNDASVSSRIGSYEQLTLKRELAIKSLASATASLESAKADARSQQLYLEPIVQPNHPDEPIEPRSWTHVAVTMLLGSILSLVLWVFRMAAAEHGENRKLLSRLEARAE